MKNILSVDIGGTNCRLAHFVFEGSELVLRGMKRVPTEQIHDIDGLMRAFSDAGSEFSANKAVGPEYLAQKGAVMAFAVAGPVAGQERITLTNADLDLDLRRLGVGYGVRNYVLVNDFLAQAYALRTRAVEGAEVVQAGEAVEQDDEAMKAVIGAGTGLGMAMLMPLPSGGAVAIPSEYGHTALSFNVGRESELQRFLMGKITHPYVQVEHILSGRGLSLLHEFLSGQVLAPWEVAERFSGDAGETRSWFSRFYGRACRDAALTCLCRGGLYIAGGIAAKNPCLLREGEFLDEFLTAPSQYTRLLRTIPVLLNANEYSGLWGAAHAASQMFAAH